MRPRDSCTDRARRALQWALALSTHRANSDVQPVDLLDALTHGGGVSEAVLRNLGHPIVAFPDNLRASKDQPIDMSQTIRRIMAQAETEASQLGHNYVGTEHLLLALASLHPEVFVFADADSVRTDVLTVLGHGPPA